MIVLGIDIGVTGAISAVDAHGTSSIVDLPTQEIVGDRVVRRKVSALGLRDIVRQFVPPGEAAMAIIEDVHMGMGKGGAARSSMDLNRGRIESVLELMRVTVHAVSPRTWQRHYGFSGTDVKQRKAKSLETARALYPLQESMLMRQKDHNRAEALLLAHYGQTVKA